MRSSFGRIERRVAMTAIDGGSLLATSMKSASAPSSSAIACTSFNRTVLPTPRSPTNEHEAAGRPAELAALDRETCVGENGIAPRQFRGRRSPAGRMGIHAWVHSTASKWIIRDRHKHP